MEAFAFVYCISWQWHRNIPHKYHIIHANINRMVKALCTFRSIQFQIYSDPDSELIPAAIVISELHAIRCDSMRCDAMQCNAMQCDGILMDS